MELMELVASLGHTTHEGHTEETCAFCSSPPSPTDETNDFTDKADEDGDEIAGLEVEGIAFKNNAARLGDNVRRSGYPQLMSVVQIEGIGRTLPVHSAAHHAIPGNASLKVSKLKPYLHTEGTATGNIGYDVNNQENGVWLAGNYALRGADGLPKWGAGGTGFTSKYQKDPKEYAFAAIEELRCQFHDAHREYSDFVLGVLDRLAKKMAKTKDLWCPEAKKKEDDPKKRQLFMLVARLNTVSRRMKTFLTNPGPSWRSNVYTSRFSALYIRERLHR